MYMKMKRTVYVAAIAIVWAFCCLMQHIACFDVFDSNLWYLYLLATAFAAVQYLLLRLCKQLKATRPVFAIVAIVYCVGAVLNFLFGFIRLFSGSGCLMILCGVLDIVGLVIICRLDS